MSDTTFRIEETRVVGLQLSDGTEIWPPNTWHGRSVETPEDRKVIADSLEMSAMNLGITPEELKNYFRWLVRVERTYITVDSGKQGAFAFPIDSRDLIDPITEESVVDAEVVPEEGTVNGESLPWVGVGPDPRDV